MTVGVVLPRDLPAGEVLGFARRAEELGFDAVWVVEDLGFRGGFAQAGAVLAATGSLRVGIGIAPVGARVLEFAGMEAATLAQLFPGRLTLGVGHGMPHWMRSVGAWPRSPLTLLERHLAGLRALLAGETSDNGVALEPSSVPAVPPRVLAGVRGPRSLALSARLADGTVLAEPVPGEYVDAVRAIVGPPSEHHLVAYHLACVRDDAEAAVAVVRPELARVGDPDWAPHVDPLPFVEELRGLRAGSATDADFTDALPRAWVEQLSMVGTAAEVRDRLAALSARGVDEHVLLPLGPDPLAELEQLGRVVAG